MERKYSERANERGPALFSFANVRRRRHRRFACQLISLLACFVLYIFTPLTLARARSLAPSISACCRHRCVLVRYFFFIYFFIQSRRQLRRKATMRNSVFFNSNQMQGWRSQAGRPQHSSLSAVNETHSRSIYRYIYAN